MHSLDWFFVGGLVLFLALVVRSTKKYNRSVADFLSASRCGGRYLVGAADGMAGMGAISIVYYFEWYYQAGFSGLFWASMIIPLSLLVKLSGYIIYRYRSTRAMTMGQFFEMRYSRRFRLFAGFMAWVAGVINFGVFPGIGAEFFITFCGLPEQFMVGGVTLPTFDVLLLTLIVMVLFFTLTGGQISVLVTDFWQAMFSLVAFLLVVGFLWFSFSWDQLAAGLTAASTEGNSMADPFDTGNAQDFTIGFYLITWFWWVYKYEAWHGNQGYECSAASPHEQKMAQVSGALRGTFVDVAILLIPIVAIAIMHNPEFVEVKQEVEATLQVHFPTESDEDLQGAKRMTASTVLTTVLPAGLVGLFAAAMLGFLISTHNTYLHAWGVIGVQDFLMPILGKPLSKRAHMIALRASIILVGVIIFFISKYLLLPEYITMFFMMTGAIYIGGAGIAIVGGLYWKRGTTAGAWAGMLTGAIVACVGMLFVLNIIAWESVSFLHGWLGEEKFPFNGSKVCFGASVSAILAYILVSLLGARPNVNFDKIFHRGKYAVEGDMQDAKSRSSEGISIWWRLIGVNSHEFTKWDRFLYVFVVVQSLLQLFSFAALAIAHFSGAMTMEGWLDYWFYYLLVSLLFGLIGAVWVTIGGFRDLRMLYKRLSTIERDEADDGWVEGHELASESKQEAEEDISGSTASERA